MLEMSGRAVIRSLALLGGLLLGASISAAAQTPVRGTMALQGTVKKVYAAANTVIVGTIDGVEHVFHFTKDLLVHGGSGADGGALRGLREGSPVVVHYTQDGANESAQEIDGLGEGGLKTTEGLVTRVDRARRQITIKFADGKTETLQLTERAAADAGKDIGQTADGATKVIVYYSDEGGRKVAHFFRRSS